MAFSAPTLAGSATSTATALTTDITTTVDIPAGALLMVAAGMDTTSAHTIGITSITPLAGAIGSWAKSGANRAVTIAEHLWTAPVTTTIPAGSIIRVTTPSNHTKRGFVVAFTTDHDTATPDVNTGDPASGNLGSVSYGDNGTTTLSASIAATSTDGELLVAAVGLSGTGVLTPSGGWATLAEARTTSGTSDRGVALLWRVQSTAGATTVAGALTAGAWAASAQTFTPAVTAITTAVHYSADGTTLAPCRVYHSPDGTTLTEISFA